MSFPTKIISLQSKYFPSKGFTRQNFAKQNLVGFTLLELLVVIAILGILLSIGFVFYQRALQNARDQTRLSDLSNIKIALEIYFEDHLYYPASSSGDLFCDPPGRTSSWSGGWNFTCGGTTYMKFLPRDPGGVTVPNYCYVADPSPPNNTSTFFKLYVLMENDSNANIPQVSIPTCPNLPDKNYVIESEK